MCGIVGKIAFRGGVTREDITRMSTSVRHRGPDGEGLYVNREGTAGLGHRRLAVIDRSPRGAQPMSNEDKTAWLVCNGEIYNHVSLRRILQAHGHRFASQSDNEVVLHAYEEYGEECVHYLDGMFAFAVWDDTRKRLFFARDRVGKKPFKYYTAPGIFIFASELKAILADSTVPRARDEECLFHFFAYNHLLAPATGFKTIAKLPAGYYGIFENGSVSLKRYWKLEFANSFQGTYEEAQKEVTGLVQKAVQLRLHADVPVGVFLSGGVDSTIVAACMKEAHVPLKTFAAGSGAGADERPFARALGEALGADHHDVEVQCPTPHDMERLIALYEEPYADSSAWAVRELAAYARPFITVALSGDGGDEAFAGYKRYRYWDMLHWLKPDVYHDIASYSYFKDWRAEDRLRGHARTLRSRNQVFQESFNTFLPDDLLVKTDMASMSVGLEVRSPFLDHHLLKFIATLPASWKMNWFSDKIILKDAFRDMIPASVFRRPKHGFEIPVDAWFRGPLSSYTRDILLDNRTIRRGYYLPGSLQRLLTEHESGARVHGQRIWLLLCFELWNRIWDSGI